MLRGVDWYLVTDVSGQHIGPHLNAVQKECLTLKDVTDRLSRKFVNYQSTQRRIYGTMVG